MGQIQIQNQSVYTQKPDRQERNSMALFEITPFSEFYHPIERRNCRRRSNCGNSFSPSVWQGYPAMELAMPTVSQLFSRNGKCIPHLDNSLNHNITDESVDINLPLDGFNEDDIDVTIEDGTLKIEAKKEEKNDKGETVTQRMVKQVVSLPENCDADNMEVTIDEDSMLAISVPRKAEAIESETGEEKKMEDEVSERTLATIPVQDYKPEELSVKITSDGKTIEVSGNHAEESEDGKNVIIREFTRMFACPEDVDVEKMGSHLNGGELIIKAPVVNPSLEATVSRSIPIQMETEGSN